MNRVISSLALLIFSSPVIAGFYGGVHYVNRDFKDEGQLDNWSDQTTECWSCENTKEIDENNPFGILIGVRTSGNIFLDVSAFINDSGEYDRTNSISEAHYTINTEGYCGGIGGKWNNLSLSGGICKTNIDGTVYAWHKGWEEHYKINDSTHSPYTQVDYTYNNFGLYIRHIFKTGSTDGFGKKPLTTSGLFYLFN